MFREAEKQLQRYYGYASFRNGQQEIVTSLLARQDTLGIMPTGGGKSVCYQIPALLFPGLTLVISPLIALMKDQVDALASMGIQASFINSSLSGSEVSARMRAARLGEYKLLYIAPERLEAPGFRAMILDMPVSFLAIDEAHCMSQWGHDFRPSYRAIADWVAEMPERPLIGAFTATATQEVREDIIRLLALRNPNVYISGFDRDNLTFLVRKGENKQDFILSYIKVNKGQSGIIYAATRREVDGLHALLVRKGITAGRYHAGLSDTERSEMQERFLHDDLEVMVASNAFGMGINKSNVRYVIHHNMPKNIEAYYQEAGRAGRDGEPGECVLLFGPQDVQTQRFFIEQSELPPERKENEYRKLQAMVDYCHTTHCLRQHLLQYFGEAAPAACGACSSCTDEAEMVDSTVDAQKIFSCIYRMRERFGAAMVAGVLKGSRSKKVLDTGFNSLPTYGIMANYTEKQIVDLIHLFTAEGYLALSEGKYPVLSLLPKSWAVLKNGEQVLRKVRVEKQKAAPDDALFEQLRAVRKEIAQREGIPPYIVFSDRTLREMSELRPADEEEMHRVKGMGDVKFERYGLIFLEAIQKYVGAQTVQ
ncbi:ATP-dependent DNA helicase RecQ [Aneurinibacillus soli]|uniref:DNA helicase RecQ n=1 Tax=Aneurinibacillus soli TaxID=1500254 RepID=A0A0U5B327_9BACL|nr:DNA helicase RecQ [Aneurinibacillus soli]PYE57541.1 ATP-dependent DNA helicase RecQ [Aneurinibacillus soli]BAU26070.1 ATP-dependent DNA helicase RecQ [Aneurinibacillus soli]